MSTAPAPVPTPIGASLPLAAFFALLELWAETLRMRLAAVEAPVRVSQYCPGATNYSATPTRIYEGSDLSFDDDCEQWYETHTAPLFEVKDDARQEQHRLLQALGLLRSIRESIDVQNHYWIQTRLDSRGSTFAVMVTATSVRDVREALGAVGIDPTLVILPKWPERVWL